MDFIIIAITKNGVNLKVDGRPTETFTARTKGQSIREALDSLQEMMRVSCGKCLAEIDMNSEHARGGSGLCEPCWNDLNG